MSKRITIDEVVETNEDVGMDLPKRNGKKGENVVTITPPNLKRVSCTITGTSPYVQHKFAQKAMEMMRQKQEAGPQAKKGKAREAKDFHATYLGSHHTFADGSGYGIPAAAFRNALISACRLVGFKMTVGKLALVAVPDGYDNDGAGLIRITRGEPHPFEAHVRLETGVADIAVRTMFDAGWQAKPVIEYDADAFQAIDVLNLLERAGRQVGIGAGRNDSKKSCGQGWGSFTTEECGV